MNSTILVIDRGQFNSVPGMYEPETRREPFRIVPTTPVELRNGVEGWCQEGDRPRARAE